MDIELDVGLETIVGLGGRVTLGWVGEQVFYSRLVGTLSQDLNAAFTERLRQFTHKVGAFQYFCDARELQTYDMSTRGALLDFVADRREQLTACISLTWREGLSNVSRAFVAQGGPTFEVLTNGAEFEEKLSAVAPLALAMLEAVASVLPDPPALELPTDREWAWLDLNPITMLPAMEALDERASEEAEQVLEKMLIWLEHHDNYQCEFEAPDSDSTHLVWDAVLAMARIVGFETRQHGGTVFVTRKLPWSALH